MLVVHFGSGYLPGCRDLIIELTSSCSCQYGLHCMKIFQSTPQPFNKCMINWFVYFLAVLNARESWWLCINLWEVSEEDKILYVRPFKH